MADINSIQQNIISQKYTGSNKSKCIELDFGGHLYLNERKKWIYVFGVNKINTFRENLDGAKRAAERISLEIKRNNQFYENIFRNCMKNSKRRGIEFSLTRSDMKILITRSNGKCELTNIEFHIIGGVNKNERQPFVPSIDRIDSCKGYSLDNCRLICVAANFAINTWGEWVLLKLAHGVNSKNRIGKIKGCN